MGWIVALVLAVVVPAAAGYFLRDRRVALALVALAIVVISFAPLGADQPAPWQSGYPADGDWRLVAFPLWLLVALSFVAVGARLRARPEQLSH